MRVVRFNILVSLVVGFLLSTQLVAQDPIFSQFYLAPTHISPAFVGINDGPNFYVNYRNQWPGMDQAFVTYAAAYDQQFESLHSGIGLIVVADNAGQGLLENQKALFQYSYRLRINREWVVKAGIELGAIQTRLGWDQLIFFDQLDPEFGATIPGIGSLPTSETPPDRTSVINFDLGFGLAAHSDRFYGAISLSHLTSPTISFYNNANNLFSGLPMRFTVMAGAQFGFDGRKLRPGDAFLSPQVIFVQQGRFRQLNLGLHAGLGAIFGGLAYRHAWSNPDALIASVGFRTGSLRIGYSYDITLSSLAGFSQGAHEIGLTYIIRKDKKTNYEDCFELFR